MPGIGVTNPTIHFFFSKTSAVLGYDGHTFCLLPEMSLFSLQGKSYTLVGSGPPGGAQKGILARSMTRLFSALKTIRGRHVSVRISFLGMYCETLQVIAICRNTNIQMVTASLDYL